MSGELTRYAVEDAYKGVERDALERTKAQDQPKAVFVGGQPGAGKTELTAEAVREARERGGAVVIDSDRMREENPRFKQLSREDPQNAADRTQREAAEWSTRLTMAAMEGRRDLVIDGTMRDPANVRDIATRLKENGYQVEARVMAVDPETSITRARLRFEEQVAERGTGRFVNQEQHDRAYEGVPASLRAIEAEKLMDRVQVHDSNQRPIYENTLEHGEWRRSPEAAAALEQERNREWTHAERRDYATALQDIATLTRERTQEPDHAVEDKLRGAYADLAKFEQSDTYRRADAFDHMPKREALAAHPELDGAYAQLRDLRAQMGPQTQHEREQTYFNERAALSEQLHRGQILSGSVTKEESVAVIELAAEHRNVKSVRDAGELQRDVRGEVVAVSSQHALVKISDDIGVRIEKGNLDRGVSVGEQVAIHYDKQQRSVYEQGKETSRDQSRDQTRGQARDNGRDLGR